MLGSAPRPIFDTLTHTRATQMCSTMFNDELKATLWHRQHLENTHYHRPGHHTLSFYGWWFRHLSPQSTGFTWCTREILYLAGPARV